MAWLRSNLYDKHYLYYRIKGLRISGLSTSWWKLLLSISFQVSTDINSNYIGFPKLISYGVSETQNYIVTELLGPSLKDKLKEKDGPFNLETVCLIGL